MIVIFLNKRKIIMEKRADYKNKKKKSAYADTNYFFPV
jgi:hypothetical protein